MRKVTPLKRLSYWLPVIAGMQPAIGQDVLAPPPPEFSIDSAAPFTPLYQEQDVSAVELLTTVPQAGVGALQWGLANLDPRFLYRLNYSEGLRSAPGSPTTKTLIHELHPGISIDIGKLWDISYAPVARFYMNDRFRDTFNHNVRLTGGTTYGDWVFGLRQTYASTADPSLETASQTDQQRFVTALSAGYAFNSKVSLDLNLSQRFRLVDGGDESGSFNDSRSWSTMNWLNYQIVPKVGVGVGAGATYTDVSQGSDMLSEQGMGRVTWRVQEKLFITASGGIEIRQFLDSEASDALNPLFTITAQYRLFEHTLLSLSGSQTVRASTYRDTITESTFLRASLNQRLLGHLNLTLSGGLRNSSYSDTQQDLETTREDEGTFFDARLSSKFLKRATASVFFRRSENQSSGSGFDTSTTQIGAEVGYTF